MNRLIRAALLLTILTVSLAPGAQAGWFFKKKASVDPAEAAVQTYQPPPPEAVEERCGELRDRVIEINLKPDFVRAFYAPRREALKARHRRCVEKVEGEMVDYMKRVDIEAPPGLMPLDAKTSDEVTAE